MKLTRPQNILLQIYRRAAHLEEHEYRDILKSASGCPSARSDHWTQYAYDRAMAAIETRLWIRVQSGDVPDPRAQGNRYIRGDHHWRRRNPGDGRINSRHVHKIRAIWRQLCPLLEPRQRNDAYLAGIIARATGRTEVGQSALTAPQAAQVIEALKDRLARHLRAPCSPFPVGQEKP